MYIKVIDLTAGVRGFLRLARYSRYSGTVEGRPSYATHLRESWASLLLFYFILSYLFFGYFLRFSLLFFQHVCVRVHVCVPRLDGFTCRTTTLALACEIKLFVGSRKMKINFCLPALPLLYFLDDYACGGFARLDQSNVATTVTN